MSTNGNSSVNEGSTYTLLLTPRDPGSITIDRWEIDWDDGHTDFVSGNPSSVQHPYADGFISHTITATAYDDDGVGSTGSVTRTVTVLDVAPTVSLSGNETVAAGETYALTLGPATDPGADTITSCTINWDDGTVTSLTQSEWTYGGTFYHVYSYNPGTYITVDLVDEDGIHYAVAKKTITVTGASSMASLVDDINTVTSTSSSPHDFVVIGDITYFVAATSTGPAELWRTDGTEANTYRVKSVNCGYRVIGESYNSPFLTNVGGTLYFVGDDGDGKTTLWKSDGTEAGTVKVANVSSPYNLVSVDNTLFFRATDAAGGSELWKSDGTEAGTVRVKDIYSGSSSSSPSSLTNVNGTLFFTATDSTGGYELWKSDGTEAGTVRVKDIYSGTSSSSPSYLTNVNGTLYFTATNGSCGAELWESDGTESGTYLVKDIYSGSSSSSPYYLTNVNGTLYFTAADSTGGRELWKSDGTEAGTVRVKDIYTGSSSSSPSYLTNVNGTLFFRAADSTGGYELWKSDGTQAGTVRVKDIYAGTSTSNPSYLTNVGGTLFFTATDSTGGSELWKSDGTETGTVRVKDIYPGTSSSSPYGLINFNGTLLFRATDANGQIELWKSDGTEAGTVRVKDIYAGTGGSGAANLTSTATTFFFTATDGATGTELWKSDGTATGTSLVRDIYSGASSSYPSSLAMLDGIVYFAANDGTTGSELWRSDGTESGTYLVKNIYSGTSSSSPSNLTVMNGNIYFTASDSAGGSELWVTDGTTDGTVRVKDICSGTSGSYPAYLTVMNGWLYFQAADSTGGYELWKSDGTDANTSRVMDIYSGTASSSPTDLKVVDNRWLYFRATTAAAGYELWKSDGTAANTSLVKDIYSGTTGSSPYNLTVMNGKLYFTAGDSAGGTELWVTDGTAANTTCVMDIYSGTSSSCPSSLTVVGNTLYFAANDGSHGAELWKSDGTAAGTVLVRDIMAGSGTPWSESSSTFTDVNGIIYFTADNGSGGIELWKTDGTATGTARVMDIRPGVGSSYPGSLKNVNGTLYFVANDGEDGTELWAVRPPVAEAGSYTVVEGDSVTLSAASNTGGLFSYAWDLDGDGIFGETGTAANRGDEVGVSPTFLSLGRDSVRLNGPSTYTVSLRVTDAIGVVSTDTASIAITPILTWDPDGLNNGLFGGTGSWTQTNTPWVDTTTGQRYNWSSVLSGARIIFTGGTGSIPVTLTDTVVVSDITFSTAGYSISTGGTITLTGVGGAITTETGASTIASVINGSVGLTKLGTGTLTLSGANTYSGGTILSDGILTVYNDMAFAATTLVLVGGTLIGHSVTLDNSIVVPSSATPYIFEMADSMTLNGNITGDGTIKYTGSGVLYLGGDNSGFYGTFSALSSPCWLTSTNANAGSAQADWAINGVMSNEAPNSPVIHLGSLSGSGTLRNDATGGAVTYEVGGKNEDSTFSGRIINGAGTVALTKVGTGTLTLTGALAYTGPTTVLGGKLLTGTLGAYMSVAGYSSVDEGATYTLNLASLDSQNHPIVGWQVNWGDGSSPQSITAATWSPTHTYADGPAAYTITITATGADASVGTCRMALSVDNVAPTLTIVGDQTVAVGQPLDLTSVDLGAFSDPGYGAGETFTYTITWGDGYANGGTIATLDQVGGPGVDTEASFGGYHQYSAIGTYTVTVTIVDDNGGSDTDTFRVFYGGIPAVTGLTAGDITNTQVTLSWSHSSSSELGFVIEKSTDGIDYEFAAWVDADATSCVVTGLTAATNYHFRVSAYSGTGITPSSPVTATTSDDLPDAPTGLAVTETRPNEVQLAWTVASDSEQDGFKIEQSTDGVAFTEVANISGSDCTSATIAGLSANTNYYFRIRAYNTIGNSSYCTTVASTKTGLATPIDLTADVVVGQSGQPDVDRDVLVPLAADLCHGRG